MKTKQITITLCLLTSFGLTTNSCQSSKVGQPAGNSQTATTANTTAANASVTNLAEVTAQGTPAAPISLGGTTIGNAQKLAEAYKMLYAAVKAKNTEAIKRMMSQKTLVFAEGAAAQSNTEMPKFYENGLTATTFAPNPPRMRDERVKDNMGALEVWNEKEKKWEDLPFVKEADGWKLAVGDVFAGTYKSPAKGQAQIEMEKMTAQPPANMTNPGNMPPPPPMQPGIPPKGKN